MVSPSIIRNWERKKNTEDFRGRRRRRVQGIRNDRNAVVFNSHRRWINIFRGRLWCYHAFCSKRRLIKRRRRRWWAHSLVSNFKINLEGFVEKENKRESVWLRGDDGMVCEDRRNYMILLLFFLVRRRRLICGSQTDTVPTQFSCYNGVVSWTPRLYRVKYHGGTHGWLFMSNVALCLNPRISDHELLEV